ncbi:unnamed protein product [Hermetia illucens]|uniref:Lipase domain-containing protein n=1 Tax=Hermetia illucens TaxID=343691 RepID=A0A7R8UEV1_HERIL|nr:unnamed protein product [Hermetia illucens]
MKCIGILIFAAGFIAAQEVRSRMDITDEWNDEWSKPGVLSELASADAKQRGLPEFDEKEFAEALGWTGENKTAKVHIVSTNGTQSEYEIDAGNGTCVNVTVDNRFGLDDIVAVANVIGINIEIDHPALVLFDGNNIVHAYNFSRAADILDNPKFDRTKDTVIYIHGFLTSLSSESTTTIISSYAARNDHNIIVLDWHSQALPPYFLNAVKNVFKIGAQAAGAILDMIDKGLSVERLHLVGHSLGAQMAGVIGRTIQRESNGAIKLPRISALDPAYPAFYGKDSVHLSEKDAELVDVIHTDSGVYGAPISTGTVDFWPNGAEGQQPGCILNVCSHQRAWMYWAESLQKNAPLYFSSAYARSWMDFKLSRIWRFDPKIVMGYGCLFGTTGNYYLLTNNESPFARGKQGMLFR